MNYILGYFCGKPIYFNIVSGNNALIKRKNSLVQSFKTGDVQRICTWVGASISILEIKNRKLRGVFAVLWHYGWLSILWAVTFEGCLLSILQVHSASILTHFPLTSCSTTMSLLKNHFLRHTWPESSVEVGPLLLFAPFCNCDYLLDVCLPTKQNATWRWEPDPSQTLLHSGGQPTAKHTVRIKQIFTEWRR